jgi:hypothetical protein
MNANPALADSLERMADLVRLQHSSLDKMLLKAEGKYQPRTVALETLVQETTACLAKVLRHRDPEDFPMLYYAWGKCRVGSTPLSNLFALAGMPSFYQPVKGIFRHSLLGSQGTPWAVPSAADQPIIFAKETGGPYVLAESLFVPLQSLVESAYPAGRLHLLILDREPESSLASWLEKWGDRMPEGTLVYNYVVAALNAVRVESYARRHGIPVTHYVYEATKESVPSARALFGRLGLASRFDDGIVTEWKEMGQLESESSRIIFSDVPSIFPTNGIHGSDTAYRYRGRQTNLNERHADLLERSGVNDVYRASVAACVRDLGLSATTSAHLFSDCIVAAL